MIDITRYRYHSSWASWVVAVKHIEKSYISYFQYCDFLVVTELDKAEIWIAGKVQHQARPAS